MLQSGLSQSQLVASILISLWGVVHMSWLQQHRDEPPMSLLQAVTAAAESALSRQDFLSPNSSLGFCPVGFPESWLLQGLSFLSDDQDCVKAGTKLSSMQGALSFCLQSSCGLVQVGIGTGMAAPDFCSNSMLPLSIGLSSRPCLKIYLSTPVSEPFQ